MYLQNIIEYADKDVNIVGEFVLDNKEYFPYNVVVIGVWRSLVSRLVRVQEASGSNPDTPTKKQGRAFALSCFFIDSAYEPEASCISIFGRKQMRRAQSASGSNPDTPTK